MTANIYKTILLLILLLFLPCAAQLDMVQADQEKEYKVKAAFIFNFIKFVEWPEDAGEKSSDIIQLAVVGDNPFGDSLSVMESKDVKGKKIQIHYFQCDQLQNTEVLAQFKKTNVLFVCKSEKNRYDQIVSYFDNKGVLTIGDEKSFAASVGVISFDLESGKVCFDISFKNAKKYGVKLNVKLFKLAREVYK